jgi:hypothetical protein
LVSLELSTPILANIVGPPRSATSISASMAACHSRHALFTLSMPSLPASARLEIERRPAAGERVTAGAILKLRAAAV